MDKATAKAVLDLANKMTAQLLQSVHRVTRIAPEQAALAYRRSVLEVLDPMGDVVFSLWRQHPDLEPKEELGVTYYDPKRWFMQKAEVRRAARVIDDAQGLLRAIDQLVRHSGEPNLAGPVARARDLAGQAAFAVRQQNAAFRGRTPKEDPLRLGGGAPKGSAVKARRRTKR